MSDQHDDQPLPATARFVLGLGVFLVVAWALMFALLMHRA
jgi:hypothetical protein